MAMTAALKDDAQACAQARMYLDTLEMDVMIGDDADEMALTIRERYGFASKDGVRLDGDTPASVVTEALANNSTPNGSLSILALALTLTLTPALALALRSSCPAPTPSLSRFHYKYTHVVLISLTSLTYLLL